MQIFLSELSGRGVYDQYGKRVGRLKDLVIHPSGSLPEVIGLVIRHHPGAIYLPFRNVARLEPEGIWLSLGSESISPSPPPEDHLLLRRDLLDAQVVDTHGARILRVNDVLLSYLAGHLRVDGLDIGVKGLMRRLGWMFLFSHLTRILGIAVPAGILPLDTVALIDKGAVRVHLSVPQDGLVRMHPADLADLAEEMGRQQRSRLYSALSDEQLADLIEAADSSMQVSILHEIVPTRAVRVLEAMEPDEAADLLGEIPGVESSALIQSMTPETGAELQQLLTHNENSAGAMMTTSFLAVNGEATVKECLKWFKESAPEVELNAYFYLTNPEGQLSGVVSLRRMLFAAEHDQMTQLSPKEIYHVHVHTSCQKAVEMIAHYKLLALPVLDAGNRIEGVITIHDVLAYLQEGRTK
ncbi:MAG: magnesium transporter [Pseudomonadota bacterium]|nr:magnesium transporter [Pseudomonadota bacterium]